MVKNIVNTPLYTSGGVEPSSRASFRICKNCIKRFLAFTLAETLIVMGIIGIVSALTLPNLNSSTGEKEKVAKVRKLYQNFNDAIGRAQAVYGPVEEWENLDSEASAKRIRFGERLTEFMKVSKNCGTAANQGCFAKTTKKLSGGNYTMNDSSQLYKFILADGTSVLINSGNVLVDIDGPNKGKNQWGIDLFSFNLNEDKTAYMPTAYKNSFDEVLTNLKPSSGTGTSGSAWVINYDNMDYLKLDSNGKCPNGTTPTEQNPRCK